MTQIVYDILCKNMKKLGATKRVIGIVTDEIVEALNVDKQKASKTVVKEDRESDSAKQSHFTDTSKYNE